MFIPKDKFFKNFPYDTIRKEQQYVLDKIYDNYDTFIFSPSYLSVTPSPKDIKNCITFIESSTSLKLLTLLSS